MDLTGFTPENPPRLRMQIGRATEPKDVAGKWFCHLTMWATDGIKEIGSLGYFGPFETEESAKIKAREISKEACESVQELMGFTPSGKYFDLKQNGVLRSWDEN